MGSDLFLVTGVTGFLGTAVTLAFLREGHSVRGTVRSMDKAEAWDKAHADTIKLGSLEWAIVNDVGAPGAFDDAVKGVTVVVHTASPFSSEMKDPEEDLLKPAVRGTTNMLEAAATCDSVKHMVLTSSFAACFDYSKLPAVGETYTHESWNPATYDQAKRSDDVYFVYCASKALAEKAAWDFVEREKPRFTLTTVCPPMIIGPPEQVITSFSRLNESVKEVWGVLDKPDVPPTAFPVWCDVRDVAKIHVLCATKPIAQGQRYLTIAGHFDKTQVVDVLKRKAPELADRLPKNVEPKVPEHFATDSSKVVQDLEVDFVDFDTAVVDTARKIAALEKALM